MLHVSKTDLKGMTAFKDILVYANKSALERLEPKADPLAPSTIIFSNNKVYTISIHFLSRVSCLLIFPDL